MRRNLSHLPVNTHAGAPIASLAKIHYINRMEQMSIAAARVIIAIIPIVGIVMGSVVVFFYLLWNHRRKVLLIKAGNYNRPQFDLLSFSLLTGLLLTTVGLAVTVFLAVLEGVDYGLLGGIIPLSVGVGLLIYYGISHGKKAG